MKGRTGMKARLGIATAVLVGGGAVGVAAVAANHNSAPTAAESAGFTLSFHHSVSEATALNYALSTWSKSQQKSLNMLARMQTMRNFSQTTTHHTVFAAQRGVVELATKRFLLVKSSNGSLHLWWLSGGSRFANVSASPTGMVALTGNNMAAFQAMANNNMKPAATTMAGSTAAANAMAAPVAKPTTITVQTGTTTITITITQSTATVGQVTPTTSASPTATATASPTATATASVTATASASPTASVTTQPVFTRTNSVARGDLVFVTGLRVHGALVAKVVLFTAPVMTPTATPTTSVTPTVTPTTTVSPTVSPTTAPSATATTTFSGTHA
jgi:hypothetical protein